MNRLYLFVALYTIPFLVEAASKQTTPTNFKGFVAMIGGFINTLVLFLFGLMFVVFTWKMIQVWIFHGDDSSSVSEGKNVLISAIIGFVVLGSLWGIVTLLRLSLFK